MARNPAATWRGPVPNVGGNMSSYNLFVVHIQDGSEAGTDAWIHNPAAQVSAHFGNPKVKGLDQWVDTAQVAWAEAAYNGEGISCENEGFSGQSLTPDQLEDISQAYAWAHLTHGIPVQIASGPSGRGLIAHGTLGAAGGGHYDCPGQPIIDQFPAIIARTQEILGGADMAITDDDAKKIADLTSSLIRNTGLGEVDVTGKPIGTQLSLGGMVARSRAVEAEIMSAVAKVPGATIDYDQLGAAVANHLDYAKLSAALAVHFQVK